MKLRVAILFFFLSPVAFAATDPISEIKGTHCVSKNLHAVHDSVIDYTHYADWDRDAADSDPVTMGQMALAVAKNQAMIRMVKSQMVAIPKGSVLPGSFTDYYFWIVLQPAGLSNAKVYPRSLLRCSTFWTEDQRSWTQKCSLAPGGKDNFALDRFDLKLTAVEGCANHAPGVQIEYSLKAATHREDIDAIKEAVSKQYPIPMAAINTLFDQDQFFTNYFDRFYKRWLARLES